MSQTSKVGRRTAPHIRIAVVVGQLLLPLWRKNRWLSFFHLAGFWPLAVLLGLSFGSDISFLEFDGRMRGGRDSARSRDRGLSGNAGLGSATPLLEESSTLCGHERARFGMASRPTDWRLWTCQQRGSTSDWEFCLSRAQYTSLAGRGCPGRARCCPPSDDGSGALRSWWCLCAVEAGQELASSTITACRPRREQCVRLEARLRADHVSGAELLTSCRPIGRAVHPKDAISEPVSWTPSAKPGAFVVEGRCVLNR